MAIQPSPELIRAIQNYKNGKQQAFESLYNLSLPYLTKCVLNVINRTAPTADETLLQDILQDTYLSIAEKLNTLQNEEAFFQWAGQIATNHALRTWNKAVNRQEMEQPEDDMVYQLADDAFIPEDILENKEKQQLIRKMLQELPTPQYLCLVEYFYNGLKEREIAEKLDMPLGTVKTNLSRAKKKLKEIVETHEKKHGVKLYSMSWLLILLFMDDIKELVIDAGTAGATLSAVTAEMAAAGGTATAGGAAAGAVGLTAKIVAGVVAAVLTVGGIVLITRKPANTPPASTPTQETTMVVPETAPVTLSTEPTEPAMTEQARLPYLAPEQIAVLEKVLTYFHFEGVPETGRGTFSPDRPNYFMQYVLSGCAGTEGLLPGVKDGKKLLVTKEAADQFLTDLLGFTSEPFFHPDWSDYLEATESGDLLFHKFYGNKDAEAKIVNFEYNSDGKIYLTAALYQYDLLDVELVYNPASAYGFNIISVRKHYEEEPPAPINDAMREYGIVAVPKGQSLMPPLSFFGKDYEKYHIQTTLTEEGAIAYATLYWQDKLGHSSFTVQCEGVGIWLSSPDQWNGQGCEYYELSCYDLEGNKLDSTCLNYTTLEKYV